MGAKLVCCRYTHTGYVRLDVMASCETMWEVIDDVENNPSVTSHVVSVERLEGGSAAPLGVGSKWREKIIYKGREMSLLMSITAVTENPPRSASVNVYFVDENMREGNYTCTITTYPVDDDEASSCQLVYAYAFTEDGFNGFRNKLCGCYERQYMHDHFQSEWQDYAAAAERLEKAKKEAAAKALTAIAVDDNKK